MIFLALPYRHPDPAVVDMRVRLAKRIASEMMLKTREPVFCLVAYGHDLVQQHGLCDDLEFWDNFITTVLRSCDRMLVLRLKDWDVSEGLQHEIDRAITFDIPIDYRDVEEEELQAAAS